MTLFELSFAGLVLILSLQKIRGKEFVTFSRNKTFSNSQATLYERGAVLRIIVISGLIINYDISRFFLYVSSKG